MTYVRWLARYIIVSYRKALESVDDNLDTLFCEIIVVVVVVNNNKNVRLQSVALTRGTAKHLRRLVTYSQTIWETRSLPGGFECTVTRVENSLSDRRSMTLLQSARALQGRRRQLDVLTHRCQHLTSATVRRQRAVCHLLTPRLQRVYLCMNDYVK